MYDKLEESKNRLEAEEKSAGSILKIDILKGYENFIAQIMQAALVNNPILIYLCVAFLNNVEKKFLDLPIKQLEPSNLVLILGILARVKYTLGAIYAGLNQYSQAHENFQEALKYLINQANCYADTNDTDHKVISGTACFSLTNLTCAANNTALTTAAKLGLFLASEDICVTTVKYLPFETAQHKTDAIAHTLPVLSEYLSHLLRLLVYCQIQNDFEKIHTLTKIFLACLKHTPKELKALLIQNNIIQDLLQTIAKSSIRYFEKKYYLERSYLPPNALERCTIEMIKKEKAYLEQHIELLRETNLANLYNELLWIQNILDEVLNDFTPDLLCKFSFATAKACYSKGNYDMALARLRALLEILPKTSDVTSPMKKLFVFTKLYIAYCKDNLSMQHEKNGEIVVALCLANMALDELRELRPFIAKNIKNHLDDITSHIRHLEQRIPLLQKNDEDIKRKLIQEILHEQAQNEKKSNARNHFTNISHGQRYSP